MVDNTGLFGTLSGLTNDFVSGLTGTTPSPDVTGSSAAATTDANSVNQTVLDPAGLAQTAITGSDSGQSAQTGQQGQNQQQNQQQSPATSALDLLKKAFNAAQQNKPKPQQGNPYQIGGPSAGPSPLANLARAANGAPAPTLAQPNLPSPDASAMAMVSPSSGGFSIPGYNAEGASNQPEYGPGLRPGGPSYNYEGTSTQQEYGPGLRPGGPDYNSEGASNDPEYGPGQPEVQGPPPAPQAPDRPGVISPIPEPEGGGAAPQVPPQFRPEIGPGSAAAAGGINLGMLARLAGGNPLARALVYAMQPTPANPPTEVGVTPSEAGLKPPEAQPMMPPRTPTPQGEKGYRPEDDPSVTKAPVTGKPVKTVDPKTKKPVDPKTGHPVPTKVPTKKEPPVPEQGGEYQPKTGEARNKEWRGNQAPAAQENYLGQMTTNAAPQAAPYPSGHGPIMRDVSGASLGLPQGLGQLAQIALPLLAAGLISGFGRRRNQGHVIAPGQGRAFAYPNFNNNVNPLATFLLGMGLSPQQGQQQGQQGQQGQGPYGPGNHFGGQQGDGTQQNQQQQQAAPWQPSENQGSGTPLGSNRTIGAADDVMASIRQRESGGQNVAPYYDNRGGYYHDASGYYQIKPQTWQAWARDSGDVEAQQYKEAYQAPQAVQDRLARWALRKYGPNASYTWAASGPYPSVDPSSWGGGAQIVKSGTTRTGGSTAPNPQGNTPATTQLGPEMGAAA